KAPCRQRTRFRLALLQDVLSALPTDLLAKNISYFFFFKQKTAYDIGIVDPDGRSKPIAGDGKRRRIRPLRQARYHPDVLDGAAFEDPAKMDFARAFMACAIGGMGDDLCVPIPDEPAIKLQLFRSVRCRRLGMQNRNQVVGADVHRASPRRSEEHTSELQSRGHLVCRLLLEKKKKRNLSLGGHL